MTVIGFGHGTVTIPPSSDEPVYAGSNLIFAGDSALSEYATLTASGATPLGSVARLCPTPSPMSNYYLGGSSTIDTARNSLASPGRGGAGKRMGITYPPTSVQDSSYLRLFVPTALMPSSGDQVIATWYEMMTGSLSETFAIKNVHFLLWNVAGGAQPQINTHGGAPGNISSTGKHTTLQAYDYGFEDVNADNQANQPIGPFPQDLFDGLYHRVTVSYKAHTSALILDGHLRMWIDGIKVIDLSADAVGVTPSGGYKTYCELEQVEAMHTARAWGDANTLMFWGGVRTATLNNSQTFGIDYDLNAFRVWKVAA